MCIRLLPTAEMRECRQWGHQTAEGTMQPRLTKTPDQSETHTHLMYNSMFKQDKKMEHSELAITEIALQNSLSDLIVESNQINTFSVFLDLGWCTQESYRATQ